MERWLALMSNQEARLLLRDAVDWYRRRPHAELVVACGGTPATLEVTGRSGARYRIDVRIDSDDSDRRVGAVRVTATIAGDAASSGYPLRDEVVIAR
jgi:hypothetical protein